MAKLTGAQRMILQAISDLPKDSVGLITDTLLAKFTRVSIADVRDLIEILAVEELADVVRTQDGFRVAITASGRQAIGQFRPFPATPSNANNPGNGQRSERSTLETDQVNKPGSGDLKVNLKAHMAGSAPRPYGTGEPFHFAVDAKLVNLRVAPLFIVEARLRSKSGHHRLDFKKLCDEERPLLGGARRSETLKVYKCIKNQLIYDILRSVCQLDSSFEVVTATGEHLTYSALEVCDELFLGWPAYIIDENNLDKAQTWFSGPPLAAATSTKSPSSSSDARRGLTPEDIENIRNQVWANINSFGNSSAKCPVDGFPMKITLNPWENCDADISAYCERHGLVSIEKANDPLRPIFAGKSWTEEQVRELSEGALRRNVVRCVVCGTVIHTKIDGGYVMLNCLRCGGHGMVPIR